MEYELQGRPADVQVLSRYASEPLHSSYNASPISVASQHIATASLPVRPALLRRLNGHVSLLDSAEQVRIYFPRGVSGHR